MEGARARDGSGESEGGARGSAAEARVATPAIGVVEACAGAREVAGPAEAVVLVMDAAEGDLAMVVCVTGSWWEGVEMCEREVGKLWEKDVDLGNSGAADGDSGAFWEKEDDFWKSRVNDGEFMNS